MTVLVTGSAGFLGGLIVEALLARGETVRGLDLRRRNREGVDERVGSILDPDAVREAVCGTRAVIHAAAIAQLWSPGRFDFDRVNGMGTCRVLAEARRAGVRVVHVSSYTCLMARDTEPGTVLDETFEIAPDRLCGNYPRTKRQAELFVRSAVESGLSAVIVQPSMPIGAPDPSMTPPTVLIQDLANGALPAILDCWLNVVDARAVANATVNAIEAGDPGSRFLLSGEDIRLSELAERIAKTTGVQPPRRTVPRWLATAAARTESLLARPLGRSPKAPLTGVRLASIDCRFDNALARSKLDFKPRALDDCIQESIVDESGRMMK